MVRSAPLLTIFSMHLDILSKYWHCLLRNLRTDRGSQADKLKNTSAWHKRYNGAPPGRSQAALSVPLLRQACCLWKCSLVCCPYVRRDSNKLKALWFPRLKKELACVLRGQRQRPPNSWFFFPCQTGSEFKPNQIRSCFDSNILSVSWSQLSWLETDLSVFRGLVQGHP